MSIFLTFSMQSFHGLFAVDVRPYSLTQDLEKRSCNCHGLMKWQAIPEARFWF